jgi:FixJ family two-component response regulator
VETFVSAHDFLNREPFDGNGCLVLDIKMPGLSGTDLFKKLGKEDYSMPVVFITGHGDIPTGVQAIKEGALDFLTKPVEDKHILKAVRAALEKDAIEREKHVNLTHIRQRLRQLTEREYEVLTYVITGMLNKQIAYDLGISEKTVKVHRGRVMEKLGVSSIAELVRLAEKAGVQPTDHSAS